MLAAPWLQVWPFSQKNPKEKTDFTETSELTHSCYHRDLEVPVGDSSSVEACDYRLCVFGNRDGLFYFSRISSWPSRCSCFSSSTWAQLPSLVCLSPTITLSPRLASCLSRVSLFSSHWHWHRSLPWPSGPLLHGCVWVCVSVCLCVLASVFES